MTVFELQKILRSLEYSDGDSQVVIKVDGVSMDLHGVRPVLLLPTKREAWGVYSPHAGSRAFVNKDAVKCVLLFD